MLLIAFVAVAVVLHRLVAGIFIFVFHSSFLFLSLALSLAVNRRNITFILSSVLVDALNIAVYTPE